MVLKTLHMLGPQHGFKFGSMRAAEEAWRDQRGLRWVEETARDLRLGLYALRRTPSFSRC